MPGTIAWAADGAGHAGASGTTVVVLGHDPSATTATNSTYIGGVTTNIITPATIGATRAVSSPVHPVVGSGIAATASCSATSEGSL